MGAMTLNQSSVSKVKVEKFFYVKSFSLPLAQSFLNLTYRVHMFKGCEVTRN